MPVKLPPNIFYEKKEKNLAVIVAVSDFYISELQKNWDKLEDWDVCVLTNKPEEFPNAFYVEEYKNFIFSYVQKITFALRTLIKFKRGGLLIDADNLVGLPKTFFNKHHTYEHIQVVEYWNISIKELKKSELFINLQRFTKEFDVDLTKVKPISENIIYFPYTPLLVDILYDVERTKPIVEYTSLFNNDFGYLGHGEGLALSLVLKKHEVEVEIFKNNPFE
jgi:hypothetical protein